MPHHARAAGWTEHGEGRWWHRCDQCLRRRVVGHYFEVYPPLGSRGPEAGWWWACADCMADIIGIKLQEAERVLMAYQEWEADLIMDDEAWGGNERSLPVITQRLLDRLIGIQGPREEIISKKVTEGRLTINRARQVLGLATISVDGQVIGHGKVEEFDYEPDLPTGGHAVGQDWCNSYTAGNGPDGRHCQQCDYPEGMHGEGNYDWRAHRRECCYCSRAKVVCGNCGHPTHSCEVIQALQHALDELRGERMEVEQAIQEES